MANAADIVPHHPVRINYVSGTLPPEWKTEIEAMSNMLFPVCTQTCAIDASNYIWTHIRASTHPKPTFLSLAASPFGIVIDGRSETTFTDGVLWIGSLAVGTVSREVSPSQMRDAMLRMLLRFYSYATCVHDTNINYVTAPKHPRRSLVVVPQCFPLQKETIAGALLAHAAELVEGAPEALQAFGFTMA